MLVELYLRVEIIPLLVLLCHVLVIGTGHLNAHLRLQLIRLLEDAPQVLSGARHLRLMDCAEHFSVLDLLPKLLGLLVSCL